MRKLLYGTVLLGVIMIIASSCTKKSDYNPGTTNASKVANGWWCTMTVGGVDIGAGTFFLSTYNTADNKDSIWIDDLGNSYQFKVKAKADMSALTFKTTGATNETYPITVDINGGKVLPRAGKSKAGNVTDSIYFEAVFSDDPTTTYVVAGTARTGFIEDDY